MGRRFREGYGDPRDEAGEGNRCPGEDNCDWFLSCGGTYAEKLEASCHDCDLLPTKPVALPDDAAERLAEMVERVVQTAQEIAAGAEADLSHLSPLEWQGVVFWQRLEAAHKRAHEVRLQQFLELMMARAAS